MCRKKLPMPADDEVFELTLDADSVDPAELPNRFDYPGYGNRTIWPWEFTGDWLSGIITRRFMWVDVGFQPGLQAVRRACEERGRVPEGVWHVAIESTFEHDMTWRGIADFSWRRDPLDGAGVFFPHSRGYDYSIDYWNLFSFRTGIGWRWLVEVS